MFLFKPKWYDMLPASVKPIQNEKIRNVESFRKRLNFTDDMVFMAIMVSKWAVIKIQKYTLDLLRKQIPNASEKELWQGVILSRLQTKLLSPSETDPFAKPLLKEELSFRIENIESISSNFSSFDDVIDYIIEMDEEENRFADPTGLQSELESILND